MMKSIFFLGAIVVSLFFFSCRESKQQQASGVMYTCPMPQDSVFSDHPGKCPKCGMDLVPMKMASADSTAKSDTTLGFTCPMHPQIHSDTEGTCPICGMKLERVKSDHEPLALSLDMLLKPANQAVVAQVPMVHMANREEDEEITASGTVEYNPDFAGSFSTRFSGRITRMYVKYRYEKVNAGQPLMDIYSPDLVAAQNNLLFVIKQDAGNQSLEQAARERLLNMGMSGSQIQQVIRMGKAIQSVTVYSNRSGVITESNVASNADGQRDVVMPLELKEGMFVEKGAVLFSFFNPSRARINLQIPSPYTSMVKRGDKVRIVPDGNTGNDFRAEIQTLLPYYNAGANTLIARIPFDNTTLKLPVGSIVKSTVFTGYKKAEWLPEEAVFSLGMDKIVFVREEDGFVARKVSTGIVSQHLIQILDGLKPQEAVAANAGFLVDSESFIVTKK